LKRVDNASPAPLGDDLKAALGEEDKLGDKFIYAGESKASLVNEKSLVNGS
jgi:hypothetical protein